MIFARPAKPPRVVARGLGRLNLILDRRDSTLGELRFALLKKHKVDALMDIGANVGQYARELREGGYAGTIVSVEPLAKAYEQLELAAASDASWVCYRTLLGKSEGTAMINVAGNSVSSSIFAMEATHERAAPSSAFVREEQVPITTLDKFVAGMSHSSTAPTFLKIDTQGAELEVLNGAGRALSTCVGIELEMSLVPLYAGAPTYLEVGAFLAETGFAPIAFQRGFTDPVTRETLQVDALFKRVG